MQFSYENFTHDFNQQLEIFDKTDSVRLSQGQVQNCPDEQQDVD